MQRFVNRSPLDPYTRALGNLDRKEVCDDAKRNIASEVRRDPTVGGVKTKEVSWLNAHRVNWRNNRWGIAVLQQDSAVKLRLSHSVDSAIDIAYYLRSVFSTRLATCLR